jgi:6-phosphofructokinase 1
LLRCLHVPKTIDNDLVINDHTPGFGSAARFVTCAFSGINLDNIALPGVYVGVVMGRHAGFLTAAAAMARKYVDDGPHLIYLPERPLDMESFLEDVRAVYNRLGRCVIAVSEGIHDGSGQPILTTLAKSVEKDAHGNVQLSGTGALADLLTDTIRNTLGIKRVRGDTLGYLQRSFLGCVSDVDQREAREVGEKAAQYAHLENRSGSVVIRRTGYYATEYDLVALKDIAAKTKHLPDEFINTQGNDITDLFKSYCKPLLGSKIPEDYRLRKNVVPKVLKGT